jgi:hypothetical protein
MTISLKWDLLKKTMKKLLLLDANVIIDLHALGLFENIAKTYDVHVTRTVFGEAKSFKREGRRQKINISDKVTVIDDVGLDSLNSVRSEAKEARLGIDPGELESIAYLSNTEEEIGFCTCDKAAMTLISYMELEKRSISVEHAAKIAGLRKDHLLLRHSDKTFKECIKEGKALRIRFKKLF